MSKKRPVSFLLISMLIWSRPCELFLESSGPSEFTYVNRLNRSQNQIYQEYIMPDISQKQALGHLRVVGTEQDTPPDKILKMNNERFSIPELLFKPTDIGSYSLFFVVQ